MSNFVDPFTINKLKNNKIVLELVSTQNCAKDEIFYRYRSGRYVFWFSQYQDNGKKTKHQNCVGCIFQVNIKSDDVEDFNICARTHIGSDAGYPEDFFIDCTPRTIPLSDYPKFMEKLNYAKTHLKYIADFLYTSDHYTLYNKRKQLV